MSGVRIPREDWAEMSAEAVNARFAALGHDVRVVDDGPRCPALKFFPYDDSVDDSGLPDFGYREWRCDLREGHEGDHKSWGLSA